MQKNEIAWFLFLVIFLCVGKDLSCVEGEPLTQLDEKPLHKEKQKVHSRQKTPGKQFVYKNWPQRCSIVCAIELTENCANFGDHYPEELSSSGTGTSGDLKTATSQITATSSNSSRKNDNTNLVPHFISASKTIRKHGKRSSAYNRLSPRQKRLLLKQLRERHKKKSNFREIDPYLCHVVCDEYYQENQGNADQNPPNDEDDYAEDNYQEGEDTPIEITIKPVVPQNTVVAGVKPFGLVDFIGLDDFGPSGELARDPESLFEEKNNRKKKEEKARKDAPLLQKKTNFQ